MTENELEINGKTFSETISQLEEFMESDCVHGELFTVLRSARDFMENLNEEIQQYRAIGTIEEFKALKEKFENAKDDIRKLLSSEYGSSCQFCVHDENEDAMCCNIGGSGLWCCENARWKEH